MTTNFKVGDKNPYIGKIQQALDEILGGTNVNNMPAKAYLLPDGDFGPKTRDALMAYQKTVGLPQSGTYDAGTASSLDPYILARYLNDADFSAAAKTLNAEEAMVRAVTEVEAKGRGFFQNGKVVILFERHVFRQQLLKLMKASTPVAMSVAKLLGVGVPVTGPNIALLDETMMSLNGDIYFDKVGGYQGGMAEHKRLEKAGAFNLGCAQASASWGLFQIMGYHFSTLGYANVQQMVDAATKSESSHLKDFCKFVLADNRLITAFRGKDFLTFARAYNGPAQQDYDQKIAVAYNKFK